MAQQRSGRKQCAPEDIGKVVPLNVGGKTFHTTRDTLEKSPYFSRLLGQTGMSCDLDDNGAVFIDRNGEVFQYVLEFLRTGELYIDPAEKNTLSALKMEADYYSLEELEKQVTQRINPPESPTVFEHVFDGDNNGLVRHLSMSASTAAASTPNYGCPRCSGGVRPGLPNPHTHGVVRVSASECVVNPSAVLEWKVGRAGACLQKKQKAEEWIQIDFGKVSVRPKSYTLRVPGSDDKPYRCGKHGLTGMSCWRLVGSNVDSSKAKESDLTVLDVQHKCPHLDVDHEDRDYDEDMEYDWRRWEMENLMHTFEVQQPAEDFYRYLRIDNFVEVQAGDVYQEPGAAHRCLHFCGFEVYGDVVGLEAKRTPFQGYLVRESSSFVW